MSQHDFVSGVYSDLGLVGSGIDEKIGGVDILTDVSNSLSSNALKVPFSRRSQRVRESKQLPTELVEVRSQIKVSHGEVKKKLQKEARKLKRRYRARVALSSNKRTKGVKHLSRLECNNVVTVDRSKWSEEISNFCAIKFSGPCTQDELKKVHDKYRWQQREFVKDGIPIPPILIEDVLETKAQMTKGSTNGGKSIVVSELLHFFPLLSSFWFLGVIRGKHIGEEIKSPTSWRHIIMIFLAKVFSPTQCKQFRGISLLDTLSKFFCGVLVTYISRILKPSVFPGAACFAYTKSRSCADITFIVNHVFHNLWDWRGVEQGFCAIGDVHQAFDCAPVVSVCEAMRRAGIHPATVATFLGEMMDLKVQPDFEGLPEVQVVDFGGLLRQGGKEGPFSWNLLTRWLFSQLHVGWTADLSKGYGIALSSDCVLTHLCWSDNIFVFARTHSALQRMLQQVTDLLAAHNFKWKACELSYIVGGDQSIQLEEMVINHVSGPIVVPRVPRIKALGTVYNFDGDGDRGVEAQLDKARKAFYAEQHVFCNKLISLQKRYRHYVSRVVPVILHGCHVWTWTQSLKQKLDNFENGLLRRMFSVKRKKMANGTLEHFVTWRQRHTRIVRKSFLVKHVFLSLCARCAKRLFSFAWRLSNEKPNHLRSLILASARWRNKASWVSLQAVGQANSEGWRHAVAGQRKRRWEDVLCSIIGEDWIDRFFHICVL